MTSRGKRWIAVGLGAAILAGGLLVVRHTMQDGAGAREVREARSAINFGASGSGLSEPAPAPVPETAETIAADVETAVGSWRNAILAKDPETVIVLDRQFTAKPERYAAALRKVAAGDAEERVRAFSTRVLGKLKDPACAGLYEQLLSDKSPFVRQNAAWALGELAAAEDGRTAARRAVAELRQARSRDPAPDVRAAARGALARLE
jgi:HEAT repeat protein